MNKYLLKIINLLKEDPKLKESIEEMKMWCVIDWWDKYKKYKLKYVWKDNWQYCINVDSINWTQLLFVENINDEEIIWQIHLWNLLQWFDCIWCDIVRSNHQLFISYSDYDTDKIIAKVNIYPWTPLMERDEKTCKEVCDFMQKIDNQSISELS